MQKCCDASVCQPRQALDQLFICIEKIVTGRLNNAALRRWIKLKARRRFRKALGAPQSAKIHRPKTAAAAIAKTAPRFVPSRTRLLRLSKNLPHDWEKQRCFLGFAA